MFSAFRTSSRVASTPETPVTGHSRKKLSCPRCGENLARKSLTKGHALECPAGCGTWLDQATIDSFPAGRTAGSAQSSPVGFWRTRRAY
ncbi:MAG: hypothetical protein AAF456_25855 [Planctomycetota bacterium]